MNIFSPPTFGTRILIQQLGEFERLNPDMQIALTISDWKKKCAQGSYDVIIEYIKKRPKGDVTILFREMATPICRRDYQALKGSIVELAPQDILLERLLTSTSSLWDWRAWAETFCLSWPSEPNLIECETDDLAIQAVLAGTGIGLLEPRFITKELAEGKLLPVGEGASVALGYYVMRVKKGVGGELFADWLLRLLGE